MAPSSEPSAYPSSAPSSEPTQLPSNNPTGSPSDIPSLTPSKSPSSVPSSAPSTSPSVVPSAIPTANPSESPSDRPSFIPTTSPSTNPSIAPTSYPTTIPSNSPSNYPSVLPSVSPSSVPTVSPTNLPSIQPSVPPTPAPSFHPTGVPSRLPSVIPTMVPTSLPSDSPTELGEIFLVESAALESTNAGEFMDLETSTTFEEVCARDFLSMYIHQLFAADYDNLHCQIISQTFVDDIDNGENRRLAWKDSAAVVQVTAGNVAILLRVTGNADLPEGVSFGEVVGRTFQRFIPSFQSLLAEKTQYFKKPEVDVPRGGPDGIGIDTTTETSTKGIPTMIIIGSVLFGASVALGVSVYYLRRGRNKEPATPPQDITDDSIMLLFEGEDDEKENREDVESSMNPYLPPTPIGVGVPSEIGPQSWIEPDDELSAASPDNQGVETSEYMNPFGFDQSIQQTHSDPQVLPDTSQALVPKSRAAQILASLASESFGRVASEAHVAVSRNYPLDTVESRESEDDDTKPTVSSKGSLPTRSSANTGPSSRSDGSSTLHGLQLIGTLSGFQNTEHSSGTAPDYDSDPSHEKKTFFRKVMKRKAAPYPPTLKAPPPNKSNSKYEFSNNRRRLELPTAAKDAVRDDSSSLPTSASSPTQVVGNKSAKNREDISSTPSNETSDSLFLSRTGSSTAAQMQLVTLIPPLPTPENKSRQKKKDPAQTFKAPLSPVKRTSSKPSSSSNKKEDNTKRRPSSPYSNNHNPKNGPKRPILQEPQLQASSTMETGPVPFSPAVVGQSHSMESISVDPRRAAGTPTDSGTMRRYEECTLRSPVESFVRKNETPKGTRFLQMSTDSAQHTGSVLEDLGRLEDEWDGQLESKLSATATTPRHTNSEKFRKAPRQHIYRGDI
eukprot:scaffold2329_cov161-Amphora_coffeaeformis.AAC.4